MSKVFVPFEPPSTWEDSKCISCKVKEGLYKYGIWICPECDDRIFIKPYGGHSNPDEIISSISLQAPTTNTEYNSLTVFYRFLLKNTLISATIGTRSFPLLTLDGIMPMTDEFLNQVPQKIKLWLTFS